MDNYTCKKCGEYFISLQMLGNHSKTHLIAENEDKFKAQYQKYDYTKITPKKTMELIELSTILKSKIIKNGKLNNLIHRDFFVRKECMVELIENVFYYTTFLNNDAGILERYYCVLNGLQKYNTCQCGKQIKNFRTFTYGYNTFCTQSCANRHTNYDKDREMYKENGLKIRNIRRLNNSYLVSDETKLIQSLKAKTIDTVNKKKTTNKIRYGVENPGVLGAYSSKSASIFIMNYIINEKIPEHLCYYKGGGVNGKEYYQYINGYYFSYDLVVFTDETLKKIDFVLEYNGPWHYRYNDYISKGMEPATPYPNSKTIKETYEFDLLKLNHMRDKCNKFLIFWEDSKELKQYEYDNRL